MFEGYPYAPSGSGARRGCRVGSRTAKQLLVIGHETRSSVGWPVRAEIGAGHDPPRSCRSKARSRAAVGGEATSSDLTEKSSCTNGNVTAARAVMSEPGGDVSGSPYPQVVPVPGSTWLLKTSRERVRADRSNCDVTGHETPIQRRACFVEATRAGLDAQIRAVPVLQKSRALIRVVGNRPTSRILRSGDRPPSSRSCESRGRRGDWS